MGSKIYYYEEELGGEVKVEISLGKSSLFSRCVCLNPELRKGFIFISPPLLLRERRVHIYGRRCSSSSFLTDETYIPPTAEITNQPAKQIGSRDR